MRRRGDPFFEDQTGSGDSTCTGNPKSTEAKTIHSIMPEATNTTADMTVTVQNGNETVRASLRRGTSLML